MSRFTKTLSKEYSFDGDTVQVSFEPFTRGDILKLSPVLPRGEHTAEGLAVSAEIDLNKSMEMMAVASEIMGPRITSLSGLYDAGGNPISIEEMLGANYFLNLATEIMTDMLNASFLQEGDAKN